MSEKFSITITTGTIIKILAVLRFAFSCILLREIMMSVLIFFGYRVRSGPGRHLVSETKNSQSFGGHFCLLNRLFFSRGMFYLIIPNTF